MATLVENVLAIEAPASRRSCGCFGYNDQISRRRTVAGDNCGRGTWPVACLDRRPFLACVRDGMMRLKRRRIGLIAWLGRGARVHTRRAFLIRRCHQDEDRLCFYPELWVSDLC